MASLKTFDVLFEVPSTVRIRVRHTDEEGAKAAAMDRLGGLLDNVEKHYDRVKFGDNFTGSKAELVKDPTVARRERRRAAKVVVAEEPVPQPDPPTTLAPAEAPGFQEPVKPADPSIADAIKETGGN